MLHSSPRAVLTHKKTKNPLRLCVVQTCGARHSSQAFSGLQTYSTGRQRTTAHVAHKPSVGCRRIALAGMRTTSLTSLPLPPPGRRRGRRSHMPDSQWHGSTGKGYSYYDGSCSLRSYADTDGQEAARVAQHCSIIQLSVPFYFSMMDTVEISEPKTPCHSCSRLAGVDSTATRRRATCLRRTSPG